MTKDIEAKLAHERKELAALIAERETAQRRRARLESDNSGLAAVAVAKLAGAARAQVRRRVEAESLELTIAELGRRIEAQQATIAATEKELAAARVESAQVEIDALELDAAKALHSFLEATAAAEAAYQEVIAQAKAHGLPAPRASFAAGARGDVQTALGGYGREYSRRTGQAPAVTVYVNSSAGMIEAPATHFIDNAFA